MSNGKPPKRESNVDQLRDHIDSGRTGDKVGARDPAAAPLGTDDEAAGTPPSGEQVTAASTRERGRDDVARPARRRPVLLLGGLIALAVVAALVALFV